LTELASRRRRRKSIGKVVTDVERRVRRVEKRPGATRLKRNVVTGEKIQYRAIPTKAIQADAITANEAEFGVPVVSDTEPTDYLKAGTLWINPDDGSAAAYDIQNNNFVPISDVNAQATADGKNQVYRQDSQPSGGVYATGDLWFDTDDDNKFYRYQANTATWVGFTLGNNALANIAANKIQAGSLDVGVILASNIDAGQINAGTLTGFTVQTSSSGQRIRLSGANNALQFTNPSGNVVSNIIPVTRFGSTYGMNLHSGATPDTAGNMTNAGVFIQDTYVAMYINEATISIQPGNVQISAGTYPASSGISMVQEYVQATNFIGYALAADPTADWVVRNIKATATAGTPTGGLPGDIVVVYT
jgi:hypothetical protein